MAKSRSGTSSDQATRRGRGKPLATFTLTAETVRQLAALAWLEQTSKSQIVGRAVAELYERLLRKSCGRSR